MNSRRWPGQLRYRVSRRRALIGTAAAALGAAAIAACGGSSNDKAPQAGGLLYRPADETSKAVRGGIFQGFDTADSPNLDPLTGSASTHQRVGRWVYSKLLKFQAGVLKPSTGDLEGDLAESWELGNGGLQVTVKLRPQGRWDPRPPLNGRPVTADDVLFSWKKFAATGTYRSDLAYSVSTEAPFESVSAPDKQTVVFKLAFPWAPTLTMLAAGRDLFIMPTEAESGFNPRNTALGSNAWMLTDYRPSAGFTYRRNPNWYRQDRPFLDGVDLPIVSEAAQLLAQFRAGAIWSDGVQPTDVLATKKDLPQVLLTQASGHVVGASSMTLFGYAPGSPFLDERVRQAVSLAYDRQLLTDVFGELQQFRDAGLPIDSRLHNVVPAGYDGYWFDPLSSEMGAASKYFKQDPAEAKKLLTAAGYAGGLDTEAYYFTTSEFGVSWPNQVETMLSMLAEVGIRTKRQILDYQTDYVPNYSQSNGSLRHKGIVPAGRGATPDIGVWLAQSFDFDTKGPRSVAPPGTDPKLTDMMRAQLKEFDASKRVASTKELQRYIANKMYAVPQAIGSSLGFSLSWPWVRNLGVYQEFPPGAGSNAPYVNLWVDETKRKA